MARKAKPKSFQLIDRYTQATADLEAKTIARLDAALDAAFRQLERELRATYPAIAAKGDLLATQRKVLILSELGETLQLIRPEQQAEYERLLNETLKTANQTGTTLADELVKARQPESMVPSMAGINLEAAALQARDGAERLRRHAEEFRSRASAVIEQGLIQGWGTGRVSQILRTELGTTKSKAETIARTEVLSALNDAAQERYKRYGVEYCQWVVTIGDVCPICVARSGKVYEVGKVRVPAHPRCRCVLLPWRKEWQEMGLTDDEFTRSYTTKRVGDLEKAGFKPNNGVSPFEKMAGATRPPEAVWKPGDPVLLSQPQIPPVTLPAKTKTKTPDFPKGLDGLETVRPLGGSTGATLVRDPVTGKQYVLKRGNNPDHLREEFAADEAYRALGVAVPKARLYETGKGPVKLAEFIEGRSLADVLATGTPKEVTVIFEKLQRHFAADALLGNWDVVGLSMDNVLVKDGNVYRIDNGGSLRFRAQGELKGERWNGFPTELWSLRDAKINPQTAKVFGSLSHAQLVNQIEAIANKESRLLQALPQELKGIVGNRLAEMKRMAEISRTLQADQWNDAYISQFTRHSMGLRAAGVIDRLPKELRRRNDEVVVVDSNGKEFDNLRGRDSHMLAVENYINSNGGQYSLVRQWMTGQAISSWSKDAQAYKWFLANQRSIDLDNYFWFDGADQARRYYEGIGEPAYADTFAAWHAFNYEMMRHIQFENNDRVNQTVTLMRTEDLSVMQMNNLNPGDRQVVMRRGVAESTSIYQKVSVYGSELTVQQVPYHRVLGSYFYERYPGQGGTAFMGDDENEFVCLLDGVPFDYENLDDGKDGDWSSLSALFK